MNSLHITMAEAGQCCLGSRLHRDDCNLWESHSINQSYWAILGTCIHIWLFLCFYTCLSWFHHHICCSNHVISLIFVGAISSSWLHLSWCFIFVPYIPIFAGYTGYTGYTVYPSFLPTFKRSPGRLEVNKSPESHEPDVTRCDRCMFQY